MVIVLIQSIVIAKMRELGMVIVVCMVLSSFQVRLSNLEYKVILLHTNALVSGMKSI